MINIEAAFSPLADRVRDLQTSTESFDQLEDIISVVVSSMRIYKSYSLEDRLRKMHFHLKEIKVLLSAGSGFLKDYEKDEFTVNGMVTRKMTKDEISLKWGSIEYELNVYKSLLEELIEDDSNELYAKQAPLPDARLLMLGKNVTIKSLSILISSILEDILHQPDRIPIPARTGQILSTHFCTFMKRDVPITVKHAAHSRFLQEDYEAAKGILNAALRIIEDRQANDPD